MLKEAQQNFQKAIVDADAIANKYAGKTEPWSTDDLAAYKGHIERAGQYKEQIESIQKAEGFKAWGEGAQGTVPIAGAGKEAGQVTVEGFTPAGQMVVNRKDLSVVYDEGEGVVDKKTLEVISSKDYKQAFKNYLRGGRDGLKMNELKTLQEGSDQQGGFLVPDDVLNRIIAKQPTPARIAGAVTRLQTSRDRLLIPKVKYAADDIYTTGIRANWTGEIPASSTTHRVTEPVFGQVGIPVHTCMLSMPLTNDMVEDSAFPIVQWSSDKFSETIDLLFDDMILNGSGIGRPSGILLNPGGVDQPAIVKTGDANLVTADGIISLAYSLPEQYDMNARFILNKTNTGKAIAQLKDSSNRYLFGYGNQDNGIAGGRPKELVGYNYTFSGFMPNIAANAFPIIFGDPTGYYLVQRVGFSIQVLREVYAETNQILLLGRVRFGGQTAEEWKLKVQKVAV